MKVLGKLLAIMYTIFFTVILFSVCLLFCVSAFFKADFISSIFSSSLLMDVKLADFDFDGKEEILSKYGEDATVEDLLVGLIEEETDISASLIKEALNDEDIQMELAKGINYLFEFETSGVAPELKYEDYEYLLEKDVVVDIMKELEITKSDIKDLISEYNQNRDNYHTITQGGSQYDAVISPAY